METQVLRSTVERKRETLLGRYRATRTLTANLARPLSPEEWRIQPVPEVSPPWWVLGHTTWFFAKNILEPRHASNNTDRSYEYALNSYYNSYGARLPRDSRGSLTRPTNVQVLDYRESVDTRLTNLLEQADEAVFNEIAPLVYVGIQHEQQHQELMLSEIKYIRSVNPPDLREAYVAAGGNGRCPQPTRHQWVPVTEAGLFDFGNTSEEWGWDIEFPVHRRYVYPYSLANRLVTNGDYLEFIADGGYRNPLLWLSDGWDRVQAEHWQAPLYWEMHDGNWRLWTLQGMKAIDPHEPVVHVSFYEADAFARWKAENDSDFATARLPTEFEWELAARLNGFERDAGNFIESGALHPRRCSGLPPGRMGQLAGDAWEWTSSHFEAYPGYRPYLGALGEYNGKFMNNQRVLRGGSSVTPKDHIRLSYRNFWAPETRFQFTGIRLANDLEKRTR